MSTENGKFLFIRDDYAVFSQSRKGRILLLKCYNNLNKLLNLYYSDLTNKTISVGKMDMPALFCNTKEYPDYLALYSQPCLYHKTYRTAVCFFEYDSEFDGEKGLFNAIYYRNEKRLEFFKERFKGVRFFITPDYSVLGDAHCIENIYRIFKARVVSLWFSLVLGAIVIPNISFCNEITCEYDLDGLDDCSVVCISTKGHMQSESEIARLRDNIKATVDRLHLKAIIVYDACGVDETVLSVFDYAVKRDIEIVIPDNTLKDRNRQHRQGRIIKAVS